MKKKIILSAATVLLVGGLIGGSTFALFNASSTNSAQTFTAGTVNIDSYRDGFDTIPGPMFYTTSAEGATPTTPGYPGLKPTGYWAPGDTHVRSLVVYNAGSLDVALNKVKAEINSDQANMASQMDVAVYKILPKYLPDGTPFAPIPGDDTLDEATLNRTSNVLNPFIMFGWAFGVEDLAQTLIEQQIPATAEKLWNGRLSDLTASDKNFAESVDLKSGSMIPFTKHGALLAFVVHLDKDAGNTYQGAEANFGFTVNATQK